MARRLPLSCYAIVFRPYAMSMRSTREREMLPKVHSRSHPTKHRYTPVGVKSTEHQPTDCVCWLEHGTPNVSKHRPSRHFAYTKETNTGCCRGVSGSSAQDCEYVWRVPLHGNQQEEHNPDTADTLLQRSAKLICQLLLATCAVFLQRLLNTSSYTSGARQHCMYTLLQELRRAGPDNPALGMLVEPLLPRAWEKELDKQKLLKDDQGTDLYATRIGEKDMKQAWTYSMCYCMFRNFPVAHRNKVQSIRELQHL